MRAAKASSSSSTAAARGTTNILRPQAAWIRLVPQPRRDAHKGQSGRVGVVGGSTEYTGAPYYAAMSSLRAGGDLAFVFCGSSDAALPIKAYSPELIVFPTIRDLDDDVMTRLSSIVLGPGLGRSDSSLRDAADVIVRATQRRKPVVLDGDALWLLKDQPQLAKDASSSSTHGGSGVVVITPNKIEFERLFLASFGGTAQDIPASPPPPHEDNVDFAQGEFVDPDANGFAQPVSRLARALGGAVVVRKGVCDVISDGRTAIIVCGSGSHRRCGGQGDVLAGVLGQFLSWTEAGNHSQAVLAAYGACALTRAANRIAFRQHGRGMVTPDMIAKVSEAFRLGFEEEDGKSCTRL